jgi:hypothetical protein
LTGLGHALRFVVQSIPDAFWLVYYWAREWQVFLGGTLVLIAAQIYAQASVRSARIRAVASVRAALIATGSVPLQEERLEPSFSRTSAMAPPATAMAHPPQSPPHSPERDLAHKLEQLRSLIRSAMASLAADVDGADATGNIFCERIARLHFDNEDLSSGLTANTLELYKRFLAQLAVVSRASERGTARTDLSEALFQLNARARELVSALGPATTLPSARLARQPGQLRG